MCGIPGLFGIPELLWGLKTRHQRPPVFDNYWQQLRQGMNDIADQFALELPMTRIHVQQPGQVWNLHMDKLEKWMPDDPTQVVRYFIQLTDWQMGHFWNYGNYM